MNGLNFKNMMDKWEPIHFEFYREKRVTHHPGITHTLPCFALRKELKSSLFPNDDNFLEFLPIWASGEAWLLVNCSRTTRSYDEARSILHRDETGQIFMIEKLFLTSPLPQQFEIFTVEDSNRAWIYASQTFVDRVKSLGLEGLDFIEVGQC